MLRIFFAFLTLVLVPSSLSFSQLRVDWIATASIPGTSVDKSGLETGNFDEGTPMNRLGGFSAIEYMGHGNRYFVLSDRGPADGAVPFPCRIHEFDLKLDYQSKSMEAVLRSTTLLKDSNGKSLLGARALLDNPETSNLAFDPEGMRKFSNGDWLITEEYGPRVCRFSSKGILRSTWTLPEWMLLAHGDNATDWEMGTVPNRGLEGVAITPDGKHLVAAMQGPLAQDARVSENKRIGNFVRLIEFEIRNTTSSSRQYVYTLEGTSTGISEILAIDNNRFLVLERDSKFGASAAHKKIFLIDKSKASDVSTIPQLGADKLADGIEPVAKTEFIDLIDPKYGMSGEQTPEKPEGLTWGPKLADGRRSLVVCFDNDFVAERKSLFVVFGLSH